MNEIKEQIEKLKQMQQFPRYYLANYFEDLKAQVDLYFAKNLKEQKDKYLEIIRNIESFEQEAYNKWNSKSINTFDEEIKSIEENLDDYSNLSYLSDLIDHFKYKIEKKMFSNKTILFIEQDSRFMRVFMGEPYLLIVNDEFFRKGIEFQKKILTRNELSEFILYYKISENHQFCNGKNVIFNLDIDIMNNTRIDVYNLKIKELGSNIFNGLTNLTKIKFMGNGIKELNTNIFNGLMNLQEINFNNNKIKELHPNIFNGLVNLKIIKFCKNKIKKIGTNLFNGLINLEFISFFDNYIKELHPNLLNGLTKLREVVFAWNKIKEIPINLFTGLDKLESINLSKNEFQILNDLNLFNGCACLKTINLSLNEIEKFDVNIFAGLKKFEKFVDDDDEFHSYCQIYS
jgi:Leucine-rich repeat (LRR) protein